MERTVRQNEITDRIPSVKPLLRYFICGYFFLAFFEPYLNGVLGSISKYYILLLMATFLLFSRKVVFKPFRFVFLLWLVLKLVSVSYTTDLFIPKSHLFSQIGMIGLLIVLTSSTLDSKTVDWIVNTMWLGSSIIGILSVFMSHPYHGTVSTRQVLYLFGQEADPNNQAAFLLIGITIALYKLSRNCKHILFAISTIAINIYTLFLTGSRGGFISLICVVIALFLFSTRVEKFSEKIKIILTVAVICVLAYYIANRFLPTDIFERLFSFGSYEGGSERDVIWKNGWKLFTSDLNFIIGAGWGAYWGYNGFYDAMHNTFLSMLCDVGIVGFSLFFFPIARASVQLVKKRATLPVLLLICGFVPSFFVEAINKRFFWNVIIFLFVYTEWVIKQEKVPTGQIYNDK